MKDAVSISGYKYDHGELNASHSYLLPALLEELDRLSKSLAPASRRIFDLGCGNGSISAALASHGWSVTGVDASSEGISHANRIHPQLKLEIGSVYDDLAAKFGTFPIVFSLEVVEHLYDPRTYARTLFNLLEPGGTAIVSTPYHGYWKNLVLAMTGKMDNHFHALWDHGHIKFWSIPTLSQLLLEGEFEMPRFERVGRIPPLAKSMIAIARKPG